MKKRGFTLAEVMVALALIGIIASLTIPTFISSSRNRANAAKLSAVVSSIENAFTTMIASEAVNDLTETRFGETPNEANLGNYLKLSGSEANIRSYYGNNNPYVTLNRTQGNGFNYSRVFQTKNGAILAFENSSVDGDDNQPGSIGRFTIDVNGSAMPNVWGRDVFLFRIGNDGLLYPAGGDAFARMDANGGNCDDAKNWGCTARLVENNYEIDY